MHILILSIWLILLLGALFLCWQVVEVYQYSPQAAKDKRRKRQRKQQIQELVWQAKDRARQWQSSRPAPKSRPTTKPRREKANPQLWNQLITMVQGDTAAATRLVKHEQARHPNQSEKWLVEKAIWQLERDRH
jgi:uncharacterized membrane-anchored protein